MGLFNTLIGPLASLQFVPGITRGTVITYATLIMRVTNGAGDVGIGNAMTGMDVIHQQMHGPHITHVRGPHRRANSHHRIIGANPILTPELVNVVIAVIASVR